MSAELHFVTPPSDLILMRRYVCMCATVAYQPLVNVQSDLNTQKRSLCLFLSRLTVYEEISLIRHK